jgi:hypothetical protein
MIKKINFIKKHKFYHPIGGREGIRREIISVTATFSSKGSN